MVVCVVFDKCVYYLYFNCCLVCRDTAGQERFRTLTNAYYRGAHVSISYEYYGKVLKFHDCPIFSFLVYISSFLEHAHFSFINEIKPTIIMIIW